MKAIVSFVAHLKQGPTIFYDSPKSMKAAHPSNVVARFIHKRCDIQHGIVRMVNDTNILVVNQARGNTIQVAPQSVMMDSGAQLVVIGKKLTQKLWLTADDLAPCPFTIVTSIGHVE